MKADSRRTAALEHLQALCSVVPDRRPGSVGNRVATDYVASVLRDTQWGVDQPEFDCTDWYTTGGVIDAGGRSIQITPSPYGLGVATAGPIRILSEVSDLARTDLGNSIALLTGDLAAEPLTPKAFPFYGSEKHSRIIAALEEAAPAAVIAVTGKYPALCGALDPFPLVEDGDFAIPTGNVRPEDAGPLLSSEGIEAAVEIRSERRPARARNVIAVRGSQAPRVTLIAHIDTKPGTPGAVDNAAGVVALLLAADSLAPARIPDLPIAVEILLVNGEDHYGAPGELNWLAANEGRLDDVVLALNIDGAGYKGGRSAYSTYNIDPRLDTHVTAVFSARRSLIPGPDFYQSDHAIFAMQGRPAMAITTELVDEMLETLFHAASDTPDQVDVDLIVDIGDAIAELITTWPRDTSSAVC